ncbi:MAG TPA: hypothetical protein VHY08_22115 [Bacillota bacterium]|nr:hypothetical protein [Bacillota bacterium]
MNDNNFLGIVELGQFQHLHTGTTSGPARFTTISMQTPRRPEDAVLDLSSYEGKAIMVQGDVGGSWVYSAHVVDQAGPILTAVVREVFRRDNFFGGERDFKENPETTDKGLS